MAEVVFLVLLIAAGVWHLFFPRRAIAVWKKFGWLAEFSNPVGRLLMSQHGVTTSRMLGLLHLLFALVFWALFLATP